MANLQIGSTEIQLVQQQIQKHDIKILVLNRKWNPITTITGRVVSGNISIDASSNVRRSANLEVIVDKLSIDDVANISINSYLQIKYGILDNYSNRQYWYNFGYFITTHSGFKFDPKTRTLSLTLTDLMSDLTGDRAGTFHAYTSLVKNSQRIDDVMVNVLKLAGFDQYNIQAFSIQRTDEIHYDTDNENEDSMIPYDINFNVGVTAYEILEKLVNLYPYYQMYFDTDGVFVCERKILDQDSSFVSLDANILRKITISEDTDIDWTQVKNVVEVWGKDGLYYGEAKDENPESPFNVNGTQILREVISGSSEDGVDTNNICDRYINEDKQVQYEKDLAKWEEKVAQLSAIDNPTRDEQQELYNARASLQNAKNNIAGNVRIKGNDLAEQWAEYVLYKKARMNETITLQTILMPFITDVYFKISYASKLDGIIKTYLIQSVSHDFAGGTTTLNGVRFYNDDVSNYWDQLSAPTVLAYSTDGMTLTANISPVEYATSYKLVVDGKVVAISAGTTIIHTFEDDYAGTHKFYIRACADGWRDGTSKQWDETTQTYTGEYEFTVEPAVENSIVTNTGNPLITDTGAKIIYNEG